MDATEFSPAEAARYARHFSLPDFGSEGQRRMRSARVLVVGAGGLGCPLLLYLAAAGVGHITLLDPDVVDASNLQRQVLYTPADVGRPKALVAKERLLALNPHITVEAHHLALHAGNAREWVRAAHVVADGSDNFPTRYLVNDACVLEGKPNVYASVFRFEGQVSVFNHRWADGSFGPNYRDLFPVPPQPGLVPNCADGGILGVLPGIVGSLQASEALKLLAGIGEPLAGRLFLFDAMSFTARVLQFNKRPDTHITALIDYDDFCGVPPKPDEPAAPSISSDTLAAWQREGRAFQLIDVRTPQEHEAHNIGGELMPLASLDECLPRIARDRPVVLHCQTGQRSTTALLHLQSLGGFDNLYHLEGGIAGYHSLTAAPPARPT